MREQNLRKEKMSNPPSNPPVNENSEVPRAPLIRKLFPPSGEDVEENTATFRVFLRIKPNAQIDAAVSFVYDSEPNVIVPILVIHVRYSQQNDCMVVRDDTKLVCKPPASSKYKRLEKMQYVIGLILYSLFYRYLR